MHSNSENGSPRSGSLLILSAAILWGTTGTSQALAPMEANSLTIGALRLLIGAFALFGLAMLQGGFRQRVRWAPLLTLIAGASTALYQVTFFNGVRLTGVTVGTVITIGSSPIFAALLEYFLEREQLSSRWFQATFLSIVGVIFLTTGGQEEIETNLMGMALALGAGLSYAVFAITNKRLITNHRADEVMAVSFGLGAVLLLPLLFFTSLVWLQSARGIGVVIYLGLIATGLSYAFFGRGLKSTSASTATTLSLVEPLTAAILGVVVVGERLTLVAGIGMVLIFLGLVRLTLFPAK